MPAGDFPALPVHGKDVHIHIHTSEPPGNSWLPPNTFPTLAQPKDDLAKKVADAVTVHKASDVQDAWKEGPGKLLQILTFDDYYHCLPKDLWIEICQFTHTDRMRYIRDFFDCNNFADTLRGLVKAEFRLNGIGLVVNVGGKHAYNAVAAFDNGKLGIQFIEPQRDGIIVPGSSAPYKMLSGFTIF